MADKKKALDVALGVSVAVNLNVGVKTPCLGFVASRLSFSLVRSITTVSNSWLEPIEMRHTSPKKKR